MKAAILALAALGFATGLMSASGGALAQSAAETPAPSAAMTLDELAPGPAILSAEDAQRAAASGAITLIDIRTPQEWAQTGAPAEAERMNMHDQDFGRRLLSLIDQNPGKPVALICATGGRSGHVFNLLKQRGVAQIYNVAEGMMGSPAGKGWLAKGLPIVKPR